MAYTHTGKQIFLVSGDTSLHLADAVHPEAAAAMVAHLNDTQYPGLAARTAAGPEVFHFPATEDEEAADAIDTGLINDCMEFLQAAAKLDDWKSRLFYGKPKYFREGFDYEEKRGQETEQPLPHFPNYEEFTEGEMQLGFIRNPQLIHAILGCATEGAEMVEGLLQIMRGNFTEDLGEHLAVVANMHREGGDMCWFLELLATALETTTREFRSGNIAKLAKRYPDKFNGADAVARADELLIVEHPTPQ